MNNQNWDYNEAVSKLAWQEFNDAFDISAIVPLYYQGAIAGSEFLTYNAAKLYFCLDFEAGVMFAYQIGGGFIAVYDENNVNSMWMANNACMHDGVNSNVATNNVQQNIFYFGRISQSIFTHMKFIGYRITIT